MDLTGNLPQGGIWFTPAECLPMCFDPAAERIAAKIEAWRKNESEWAVVVLDLARELWAARRKHPSNQAFGEWLDGRLSNAAKTINQFERAALLKIGKHADVAAPLLAKTERRSVRSSPA